MRVRGTCVVCLGVIIAAVGVAAAGEPVAHHGKLVDPADLPTIEEPSLEIASGTDLGAPPPGAGEWGTDDYHSMPLGAGDFVRRWGTSLNGEPYIENLWGIVPKSGEDTISMGAPIHLPNGALLRYVRLAYYDTYPSSDPSLGLYRFDGYGPSDVSVVGLSPSSFSGGNRWVEFGPIDHPINNAGPSLLGQTYYVLAILHRSIADPNQQEKVYNVLLWYKLQVSPAPATATFNDVPVGSFGFQHIEALAASGITSGCGGGNFCPNATLTRAQMAVFLAKALGLHFPN